MYIGGVEMEGGGVGGGGSGDTEVPGSVGSGLVLVRVAYTKRGIRYGLTGVMTLPKQMWAVRASIMCAVDVGTPPGPNIIREAMS